MPQPLDGRTRNLEELLTTMLGRACTDSELQLFRKHCDSAAGSQKAEAIARGWTKAQVLAACIAGDDDFKLAGAPFLTEAAQTRLGKHHRKVHRARFAEVEGAWHFFRTGNVALFVISVALLAVGVVELATINLYPEMPATVAFCAGAWGAGFVRR